jgi:hypothetical protein
MKIHPLNPARKLSALLAVTTATVLALTPAVSLAAAFTPGNLVLVRVGDGSTALVNTGNPAFLDEYTPAGALVQSVPLPTAAAGPQFPLILGGTASTEGLITRSTNSQYLLVTGYGTTVGGSALSGTLSTAVPRVIARVDGAGNIDTTTALTNAMSGGSPRSVASEDGSTFWIAGQGTAAATGGIRFVPVLGTNFATAVETVALNVRQVNIFSGQLYISSGATAPYRGVDAVGTGVPSASGQALTLLPGFVDSTTSGSPYAYSFADLDPGVAGVDTLYLTDDAKGLTKYSLVAGNWVANGTVGVAADTYRGVTATVSGSTVTLYATRKGGTGAAGGGELVSLVDSSGYNGAFAGTPTVLATAATQTAFRGVALTPTSGATPTAPSAVITRPAPGQVDIRFYGWSNSAYVVETTTNITGPWVSFTTNEAQPVGTWNNGSFLVTDPNATNAQQYYRLILKP